MFVCRRSAFGGRCGCEVGWDLECRVGIMSLSCRSEGWLLCLRREWLDPETEGPACPFGLRCHCLRAEGEVGRERADETALSPLGSDRGALGRAGGPVGMHGERAGGPTAWV